MNRRGAAWAVLGLTLAVCAAGCGTENGPNQPPTARLVSAPPDGSEASFRIHLTWSGSDPDGRVDRFEYAVDPPPEFTEDEIAHGGPGISSEVVPAQGDLPAVTRVTKVIGDATVSFDWIHTSDTGGTFTFSTTRADSTGEDSVRVPTGRFTGMHAFYLRAVDDDGAASEPDRTAFTATTLAPVSRITQPDVSADEPIYLGGGAVGLRWTGEDPDGEDPPAGYLIRLVSVSFPELFTAKTSAFFEGSSSEWTRTDSPEFDQVILDTPKAYVIAVRAVDAAGAVEPFVDWGRNAFRCAVYGYFGGSSPRLVILEPHFDGASFPGVYPEADMTVLAGTPLHFTWQGWPTTAVASIWGYSWGLDIVDPDDDNAWSAWGLDLTRTPDPIVFGKPGTHTFHVQVRDTAGNRTRGTIVIHVLALVGDHDLLYVDDSFDDTYPRDSEHDAFWRARIEGYGRLDPAKVAEFHVHGDNDRGAIHPRGLRLVDLIPYKMLLWENRGSGFDGDSGLLRVMLNRSLAGYLGGGGTVWLGGRMTIGATIPDETGLRADLIYPKPLHPGQFAWDVLKIRSDRVLNDKGYDTRNNLFAVHPYPGREPPVYDGMDVDSMKQHLWDRGLGITHADAVVNPMLEGGTGILEPLYVYGATDTTSEYQDQLVALRWHDPDPAPEQGRIQWFGFPLYYSQDDQAQETFNRSLDWFREGEATAP